MFSKLPANSIFVGRFQDNNTGEWIYFAVRSQNVEAFERLLKLNEDRFKIRKNNLIYELKELHDNINPDFAAENLRGINSYLYFKNLYLPYGEGIINQLYDSFPSIPCRLCQVEIEKGIIELVHNGSNNNENKDDNKVEYYVNAFCPNCTSTKHICLLCRDICVVNAMTHDYSYMPLCDRCWNSSIKNLIDYIEEEVPTKYAWKNFNDVFKSDYKDKSSLSSSPVFSSIIKHKSYQSSPYNNFKRMKTSLINDNEDNNNDKYNVNEDETNPKILLEIPKTYNKKTNYEKTEFKIDSNITCQRVKENTTIEYSRTFQRFVSSNKPSSPHSKNSTSLNSDNSDDSNITEGQHSIATTLSENSYPLNEQEFNIDLNTSIDSV